MGVTAGMFLHLGTRYWHFCFSPTLSEGQRGLIAGGCALLHLHWNQWPWFFFYFIFLKVSLNHYLCPQGLFYFFNVCPLILPYWLLANLWSQGEINELFIFILMFYIKDIVVKKLLFFLERGSWFWNYWVFIFPTPFHLLREERNVLFCFLNLVFFFLWDILSALLLSLYCILYILWYAVVTSVVCWCIFLFCSSCVEFIMRKKPQENDHNQTPLCFYSYLQKLF